MNQNGDGDRNSKFTLNRKRKFENWESSGKRSRFSRDVYSQNQWDRSNSQWPASSNFSTTQKSGRLPNERLHTFDCTRKSPNQPKSSAVYSANDRLKSVVHSTNDCVKSSAVFSTNDRIRSGTIYSANERIKAIRRNHEFNQGDENSNTNSTCSKYSSVKSHSLARPSSLEERLNQIRNPPPKKVQLPTPPSVTIPSPFQYSSGIDASSPIWNASTTNYSGSQNSPLKSPEFEEAMDWSYIDEKEVLTKITELRNDKIITRVTPSSVFQEAVAKTLTDIPNNNTIFKNIYVVTDTNVFLSHLNVVKQILSIKINVSGITSPIILIPWIVIQELDYLKESKVENKLKRNSRVAINFINDKLKSKDPQVRGQSVRDAAQQNFSSKSADDGILHCCLQILEKQNRPMLLSNDTNLRNKAIIHAVSAYSSKEIIDALDPYREVGSQETELNHSFDCSKVKDIEIRFSHFFSFIIFSQLKRTFGNVLNSMNPEIRNPPWSLSKCAMLFKKYWQMIFSMILQKQFLSTLNEFTEFLNKHQDLETMSSKDVKTFTDLGLAICVFLQNGLPDYLTSARDCITNIENIIKTLPLPEN